MRLQFAEPQCFVYAMRNLLPLALLAAPLAAQPVRKDARPAPSDPARVAAHPAVRRALNSIRATNAWTLAQQTAVCEIPAPPFKEDRRGAPFQETLRGVKLPDVARDAEGNVIGEPPGSGDGPTVLAVLRAPRHRVPRGHRRHVKRDSSAATGVRLTAPGISDDCRGLAVILAVGRALKEAQVATAGRILFVATVGEEGPGNLRGVRRIFGGPMKDSVDYFISVDGAGTTVTSRAVGSARYRVAFKGPGGHSYGAFGMPNPAHAMGRAMARIADFQVPTSPRRRSTSAS